MRINGPPFLPTELQGGNRVNGAHSNDIAIGGLSKGNKIARLFADKNNKALKF